MKKVLDALVKVETLLASFILVILIGSTFLGVIMRYCFSSPFTWEEELQLACMVWISYLAAPIAFHTKSHVAIEILVDLLPKKMQKVMEVIIFILFYAIMIYFFVHCFSYLETIARTGRKTPILKIPYTWIYGIGPVSIILMLISFTYMTVEKFKSGFFDEKEEVASK